MRVVTVSGSPSPSSRTSAVVEYIKGLPAAAAWDTDSIEVRDFSPEVLVHARHDSPEVLEAVRLLERADVVIVATPVYKASYTGVLKAFLDLLPQTIFTGKTVWPIAVGGTLAHLLVLDYALKPVLYALGAQNVPAGVFIQDRWVRGYEEEILLEEEAETRIRTALQRLLESPAGVTEGGGRDA